MSIDSEKLKTKWEYISRTGILSENVIRKNLSKVNWNNIFKYQKLSIDFIREFINNVEDWDIISKYQELDMTFILEFKENLNFDLVLEYQNLTTRFEPAIFDVVQDVSSNIFKISKLKYDNIKDYTNFDLIGCNISGNNKNYNIIGIVEADGSVYVESDTVFSTPGVTYNGWLSFPESESGDISNLENVDLLPYLHKGNNLSRPFRDALCYQSLTYQYIIDNYANLNTSLISQNQNLTDLFLVSYDVDSTFTDATPTLTFDWDQLIIGQEFYELLSEPTYSWIKPKLNFQLLLKYQNLSRDFIFANLDSLQISELGRYNRNLSDDDLLTITNLYPFLNEPVIRPDFVQFNYLREDINNDLLNADFEIIGQNAIGYIYYYRTGSLINKRKINLNGNIKVSQVDLSLNDPSSRIGLGVMNRADALKFEDKQAYKLAQVSIPIKNRNINTIATGSMLFSSKNNYNQNDRFILGDKNKHITYELDMNGTYSRSSTTIYNKVTFTSSSSILTTSKIHGLITGDMVKISGSVPSPLINGNNYYIIAISDDNLKLATTFENALNNISITVADGSGNITRTDNSFILEDDINVYQNLAILFSSGNLSPIVGSTEIPYFAIKENSHKIKIALSENDVLRHKYIIINDETEGYVIETFSIPINLRFADDINIVMDRVINNLVKITIDDTTDFEVDPWYTEIKNEISSPFTDFSTSFSYTLSPSNFVDITATESIITGDSICLSGGSLPAPLLADTRYYAIRLNNSQIGFSTTLEGALSGLAIGLASSGTGTLFNNAINITNNVIMTTGNRVTVESTQLPDGLIEDTEYFIYVKDNHSIELCLTIDDAYNGNSILIKKVDDTIKNIIFNDYNSTYGISNDRTIIHFKTDTDLFIELFDDTILLGDDIFPKFNLTGHEILAIDYLVNIKSNNLKLSSTLTTDQSNGNYDILKYTKVFNAIQSQGMSNGFENVINNSNAVGVGLVSNNLNIRCFSLEVLKNINFSDICQF